MKRDIWQYLITNGPRTVQDVSIHTRFSVNDVFHTLQELIQEDFAEQTDQALYRAKARSINIGGRFRRVEPGQ